ncbi:serine hydrolase-like protein [Mugil cephalus]|uniref:serine hydrolase-like protein n=1 Tax=Mugil cephalus TaxID=48193 RepID=UPI001FB6EAA7|nr:serine hydrolase-like protein [Mugil cephalus]
MMQALKGVRHISSTAMKQAVSELSVKVPWGEIRGKVWGPEHGHPVLCLHGWADNCGTFNTLIPLLPKDYQYVAVDLPGHGRSSHRPPGVPYTFPLYVMDVCRVVDALQWSKFSIIGHSMGGNIAGIFGALYPEMVDAIVLLDSFGFLPSSMKEMSTVIRQGFDELIQFEKKEQKTIVYTYEKALERLLDANQTLSEESAKILLERGVIEVEGGVIFSRDLRIKLKNIGRISLEQSLDMQSRIKASVLVLLADDGLEKMFDQPELNNYKSAIFQAYRDRNHTLVKVQGSHHVHLNNPEAVAPLVSDFLQTKVLSHSSTLTNNLTTKL